MRCHRAATSVFQSPNFDALTPFHCWCASRSSLGRVTKSKRPAAMAFLAQLGRTGAKRLVRTADGACGWKLKCPAFAGLLTGARTGIAQVPSTRALCQTEQLRYFAAEPAAPAADGAFETRHDAAPSVLLHTESLAPPCWLRPLPCAAADDDIVLSSFRKQQRQYQSMMQGLQASPRASCRPAPATLLPPLCRSHPLPSCPTPAEHLHPAHR